MEKFLLKVMTNEGTFDTDLKREEVEKQIEEFDRGERKYIKLPMVKQDYWSIDWQPVPVNNTKVALLDLEKLAIFGYSENRFTPIENKEDSEESEE